MNPCRRCRTNTGSRCQTSPQPQYGARLQAMHGRKLEERPEQLVSNWLRVRKLPEEIHYYRNAELRSNGLVLYRRPAFPMATAF